MTYRIKIEGDSDRNRNKREALESATFATLDEAKSALFTAYPKTETASYLAYHRYGATKAPHFNLGPGAYCGVAVIFEA